MKILIIHHSGILGGGTLSGFDIINAIMDNKNNVILSLPAGENAARYKAQEMNINTLNVNVVPLTFGYYNGGSNVFKVLIKSILTLKYINTWKKIFEKEMPDLVILNSLIQWPMIHLLRSMNIKNICFVRETMRGKSNGKINRIIAFSLMKSSGVVFLSQFDKEQWKLPENVCQSIIPDLVDEDAFTKGLDKVKARKELNLGKDIFYILYVGGMNKLKGARTILNAINSITGKSIQLLFVGDSGNSIVHASIKKRIKNHSQISFIKEMKKYVKDNGLENKVKFVGIQKKMNYWYAACDVVVFPATEAHQARPIYEAGVFKKPIIASNFPNYLEYLNPEISGLVFEPGNSKELAQAIKKLYENAALCEELGKKNYELMNDYHNSKEVSELIHNFIQKVGAKDL